MIAVWSAVVLAGVSALALRHSPSPKPAVLAPQATAMPNCGDTISVSIVLGKDLTCPSGNGLIVGHASITINLNGHTLSGGSSWLGVYDNGNAAVTIENGTVSGWAYGVFTNGAAAKVIGIRATGGGVGISLAGTGSSATGNVAFKNFAWGITATGVNEKVTSNVVRENGDGIYLQVATGAVVQANKSENNTGSGIYDQSGAGVTLSGNITNGNSTDGIYNNGDPTATVASNTANYNGAYGIEASPSGKDGGGNLAKGNTTAAQCKDVVCS